MLNADFGEFPFMNPTRTCFLLACICMFTVLACSPKPSSAPAEKFSSLPEEAIEVMVSIAPQRYFVQRIGGELAHVTIIAPPDYSPEIYQVTPRQMDAFNDTDIYFLIGMPFEEELVKRITATFPNVSIADTRDGVQMLSSTHHDHNHDADVHGHHHHGDDPHIWLDPMRVKIQAHTITRAFSSRFPEHKQVFEQNRDAFQAELDKLHTQLAETLAPVRGRNFYVFHPSFGYFADAYGLKQRAVEYEGKSPGARRLYALMEEIKQSGVRAVFEQPQFKTAALSGIAKETGVDIVILDVLAEEYIDNMRQMAEKIVKHMQPLDETEKN